MRQLFWSKTFWSMGFWVVLVGAAAMLTGWPAGADPAHGVPGLSSGGLSSGGLSSGHAQRGLISYVHTSETNPTSVILIDPAQQVMSVYHIDRDMGEIQFKSVRKFSWDLSLTDYNTSNPLPEEIRNGLQRQ
jgi:hypothetical protein